jgi:hypothetical protein
MRVVKRFSIEYYAFTLSELLMPDFDDMTHQWVTRAIRAEMVKRGITFGELAERLVLVGGDENERNLRNKIARGTFSAALFVQCMAAMGCKTLNIDLLDRLYAGSDEVVIRPPAAVVTEVVRATRLAIEQDAKPGSKRPNLFEVMKAVEATDLSHFQEGAMQLAEVVKMVRATLAKA